MILGDTFCYMMTWFAALMILVSVGGSLGEIGFSEACRSMGGQREYCDYSIMPRDFPVNEKELRDACDAMTTLYGCILDFKLNCSGVPYYEEEPGITDFRKIENYIAEACKENSSVYQVISNNIRCVDDARQIVEDACDISKMTVEHQEELNSHFDAYLENEESCLRRYRTVACTSIIIGIHCGPETKDAAREILENTDGLFGLTCSEEIRNELATIDDIFEKVLIEEQKLKNSTEEI